MFFLNFEQTKIIPYFCNKKKFMFLIGIAGGTASGKTSLVNELLEEFSENEITVISQDNYYHETNEMNDENKREINFDHPSAIDFKLLTSQLNDLKNGKKVKQPLYSFKEHNRLKKTKTTHPKKIIIIEGILIFANSELRNMLDAKIYIDTDADERLIRRVKRDVSERGRNITDIFNRYQETLKPMHNKFIQKTRKFADIIIPNNRYNDVGIKFVKSFIKEKLS